MKRKLCIFTFVLMVMVSVSGLAASGKYTFKLKTNVNNSDVNSYLRMGMNSFGLDILKNEVNRNAKNNIMISPLSIFTALNITALGTGGDTRQQMLKVMKTDQISDSERNEDMNTLMNYIRNTSQGNKSSGTEIYNSIWVNKGTSLKESFLRDSRIFYDSDVFSRDFGSASTIRDMNNWVSDKSKGLIKNAVGSLDKNTKVSIFDVVHFLGKWSTAFDVSKTDKEAFTITDGQTALVSMMNDTREMRYYEDNDVKAGILDFDNGNIMIMIPKGNINSFLNKLNMEDIDNYTANAVLNEVQIKLPKLDINYKTNLNGSLIKLGMSLPFDRNKADFSSLTTDKNPLYISSVIHQCVLKLDEKKAEAAGFTGVMVTATAKRIEEIKQFYADKPFVFLIRNGDNILFAGKIEKP